MFRARSINLYMDWRKTFISFLHRSFISSATNMVQSLIPKEQEEQGEQEEVKNKVTQDEIFAVVQLIREGPKTRKEHAGNC